LFLFRILFFVLVFENINRRLGFVTSDTCCREHTEIASKHNLNSRGLTFYIPIFLFFENSRKQPVQIRGSNA
jgi:hypothetical protein